jgi:hypothetical protein
MVSGVASVAISASSFRPRGFPFWASNRRSASAKAKTLGPEPGAQHAVLGAQVLDRFALPATDPAGDQKNEEVKRSGGWHGRRTIARPALERDVAPDRPQSRAIEFWYTTAFSESLRQEVSEKKIRVTVIEPGIVATRLTQGIGDVDARKQAESYYASIEPL